MANSTLIVDYLGEGDASARPTSLSIASTALGLYYATDTKALSLWNGTGWDDLVTATTVPVNAQTGTSYAIANGDQGKLITFDNASAVAATIAEAGTGGSFAAGWFAFLENVGAGIVTLTPTTSTIDGASSLALNENQGILLVSDGTNYTTMRGMSGGSGTVTSITAGTGLSGGTITTTGTIALEDISTGEILGNISSGSASPSGITLSALLDAVIGNTEGELAVRGASGWEGLAAGTSGDVLTSNGAAAVPSWAPPSGGGGGIQRLFSDYTTVSNTTTGSLQSLTSYSLPANTMTKAGDEIRVRSLAGYSSSGSGTQSVQVSINGALVGGLIGGGPPYLLIKEDSFIYTGATTARHARYQFVYAAPFGGTPTSIYTASMYGIIEDLTGLDWTSTTVLAVEGENGTVGQSFCYGMSVDFYPAP